MFVDALGYRKGKDIELRQMAKFLAEKAKQTGADQQLGPLNPYERRIVHLAVAEVPGVTTESVGDAFSKTGLHLRAEVVRDEVGRRQFPLTVDVSRLTCSPPADTIVAIATPPGRGGIGVVRLSGVERTRDRRSACTDRQDAARAAARHA